MKNKIIVKVNERNSNSNVALQKKSGEIYFTDPNDFLRACGSLKTKEYETIREKRDRMFFTQDNEVGMAFSNSDVLDTKNVRIQGNSVEEIASTYQKVVDTMDIDPADLPKLDTIRDTIKYVLKAAFDYQNGTASLKKTVVILDAINMVLQASIGHIGLSIMWGVVALLNTNVIGIYEALKVVCDLQRDRNLTKNETDKNIVEQLPQDYRDYENVGLYIKTDDLDSCIRRI